MARAGLIQRVVAELERAVPRNSEPLVTYFTGRYGSGDDSSSRRKEELTLQDTHTLLLARRNWQTLYDEYNKGEVSVSEAARKVGLALPDEELPDTPRERVSTGPWNPNDLKKE